MTCIASFEMIDFDELFENLNAKQYNGCPDLHSINLEEFDCLKISQNVNYVSDCNDDNLIVFDKCEVVRTKRKY